MRKQDDGLFNVRLDRFEGKLAIGLFNGLAALRMETKGCMTPVFAFVTFSHDILYPTYEYAPRIIAGFGPAEDQLLAGVLMKIVGMAVAMTAFGVSFYRWYQASNKPAH